MQNMKIAVAAIQEVVAQGGSLWIEGDAIEVSARAPLPADLITRMRAHKPEILTVLRRRPKCCECGRPIVEPATAWWGGKPAHVDCGERAWRKSRSAFAGGRHGDVDEAAA